MARSYQIESMLLKNVLPWRYVEAVRTTEIDAQRSLENQSRFGAKVLDEFVERYAEAMKNGADFPALVGFEGPKGFILADGNQRLQAALKVGRETFDMYVVEVTDTAVRDNLTRRINVVTTGASVSKKDLLAHAQRMVLTYGMPVKDAARDYAVSAYVLQEKVQAQRIAAELARGPNGVDVARLPLSTVTRLGPIRNVEPKKRLADLAVKAGMTGEEVGHYVDELTALPSEGDQLQALDRWSQDQAIKDRQAARRGGARPAALRERDAFFRLANYLEDWFRKHRTPEEGQFTDEASVERAVEQMRRIQEAASVFFFRARNRRDIA